MSRGVKRDSPETSFQGNFCHTAHRGKASGGASCVSSVQLSKENWRHSAHRRTGSLSLTLSF